MLSELHMIVREIVVAACEDTLSQHGFVPDPLEDPEEGTTSYHGLDYIA